MFRSFSEITLLFALPFLVYFLAVIVRGRGIAALSGDHSQHLAKLVLAGLVSAVLGVILFGFVDDGGLGAYIPASFKDGRLVPGELKQGELK
jgi:hypothetical protein